MKYLQSLTATSNQLKQPLETLEQFLIRYGVDTTILNEAEQEVEAKNILENWVKRKAQAEHAEYLIGTQDEINSWQKEYIARITLGTDTRYTSVHKNAESVIQNGVLTQIAELRSNIDTLALDAVPSRARFTVNGVQVDTVPIINLSNEDKIKKLIAYKREMLKDEVAKQRIMYNDVVNGGTVDDAYNHAERMSLKTQDAIDGKALHISWIIAVIGQAAYDDYLKDTKSVEYSTHLSEDEPE